MVYVFSGNDLDAAAEFVRLQKPALSESLDKCRRAVEHIYAQTPVDELAELTNDDCLARYSCKKMVFIMLLYRRASSLSMVGSPEL